MRAETADQKIRDEALRLKQLLEQQSRDKPVSSRQPDVEASVKKSIHLTAGVCAALAKQPFPFADIFVLTPIQATLAYRIARLRGFEISKEQARRMLCDVAGVIGLGLTAQQTAIGLYKLGLPGLGGFMTIPLVYGLTYGIGRVVDLYYRSLAKGIPFDRNLAKKIFKAGRKEGKTRSH